MGDKQIHTPEELEPVGKTRTRNPFRFLFSKRAAEGDVPNRELFAYSAALAGQNATYGLVNGWLFYFCTNVLHMQNMHVGFLTSITRIWDAINDPIVGTIIDRRRCKNGNKLHPYLGKLPIIIGIMTMLMFVDFGVGETIAMAILLCVYVAWDMTYSFQDVALWGMMSLITPHSQERSRVSQWINIGVGAGGALVGLIPALMGAREAVGISEKTLFLLCGIVFGLGGELVSILAIYTKERVPFVEKEARPFREDLAAILKNKMLLLLLLAQIVDFISGAVPQIYFFKYCVELHIGGKVIQGENVQFIYGIITGALGALSMFFATKIAARFGSMRNLILVAQGANIVTRVIAYFVGFTSLPRMAVVAVLIAFSSIFTSLIGIAQRTLICDAVDYMEWKTGTRTEGVSFSMQNLTNKVKDALKLFSCGVILEALHFDGAAEVGAQPQAFYDAQWPIFMLLPALGALLYLIPFLFIRYSKAQREQVERELAQRHAEEQADQAPTVTHT